MENTGTAGAVLFKQHGLSHALINQITLDLKVVWLTSRADWFPFTSVCFILTLTIDRLGHWRHKWVLFDIQKQFVALSQSSIFITIRTGFLQDLPIMPLIGWLVGSPFCWLRLLQLITMLDYVCFLGFFFCCLDALVISCSFPGTHSNPLSYWSSSSLPECL